MSDLRAPLVPDGGLSRRDFLRLTAVGAAAAVAHTPHAAAAMDHVARRDSAPRRGGTLRLGDTADVVTFEPYATTDNSSIWTMLLLYDQLARPTADGLSVEPSLAASWTVSADGKTYTFHLRRGVTFHDGSELTAADVKFCLERAAFAKNSRWTFLFSAFKGMEVIDPYTVTAHLTRPHAPFLADMALFAASIYPRKLFAQLGAQLWQHPIGSGPFAFVSWQRGTELTLARNPSFWRRDGQPYVDEYRHLVVEDDSARVLQVQSGELDICLFPPSRQAKALQGNPQLAVHVDNYLLSRFLTMNVTRKPFTDRRVRQALNYATDKRAVVDTILAGFGQPSGQALPLMFGHDPSIAPYPYDPAMARALLRQAGYAQGPSFELLVPPSSPDPQIATLLQQQWARVGVALSIRTVESNTLLTLTESPPYNYQMKSDYVTSDIVDPDELVDALMVGNGGALAVWSLYNNKEVDALAVAGAASGNREQRRGIYARLSRLHHDDAPLVFLCTQPSVTLTNPAVQGFKVLPTGNFRLENVWLQR